MNNRVTQLFQSIRVSQPTSSLSLKVGQIITGNVQKFLPQNKAFIQIGKKTVVAELKNALQANQRYIFQVKQTAPYINLQVLNEKPVRSQKDSVANLLQHFGWKSTEKREGFVSQLLKENVPIKESTIQAAISLLDRQPDGKKANVVLLEMLKRELPITKSVYHSLYQRMFEPLSFSNIATSLNQYLLGNESLDHKQLSSYLTLFSKGDGGTLSETELKNQIINDVKNGSSATFSIFKKAGFIQEEVTFSNWREAWTTYAKGEVVKHGNEPASNGNVKSILPLSTLQSMEDFFFGLKSLLQSEQAFTKQEKAMIHVWLLQGLSSLEKANHSTLNESFMIKLKGFMSLMNPEGHKTHSLPMLLQSVLQESHNPVLKQDATTLLQAINGMHLSNVEHNDWQQFSVQLPGQLFGLKKDVFTDFEGKKDPNGKVNVNHCRIMFYLDLEFLNEVVMDMKVQNRIVTLTVFQSNPDMLRPIVNLLQPKLIETLKDMDYKVSSIHVKDLNQNSTPYPNEKPSHSLTHFAKGVDLQV